jgi:hypothetical protein
MGVSGGLLTDKTPRKTSGGQRTSLGDFEPNAHVKLFPSIIHSFWVVFPQETAGLLRKAYSSYRPGVTSSEERSGPFRKPKRDLKICELDF